MAISGKITTTTNPSPTLHPPYLQMISEAISSLKDRTGSSQPAIAKFMEEKYSSLLPPNFKKMLSIQLKKFVKSEKLVKIKNSYEVSASENVKLVATAAAASIKEFEKPDKAIVKNREKTKRLSQVKTPEALKKKKKVLTPAKRNSSKSVKVRA
ncbi:histone H1-like [Camellia sinensis]|uniref:H15 domain-containing protein n=1 Tax=Camellia sinensis var. sinensis TaxID=542762 RepID=A0A4V3WQF3_CAMSN|nr:histone H1-like [Camellia sinensis]THG20097.1 hypothetical protein TEA_011076 [Camellia sinensis var. sinensis]